MTSNNGNPTGQPNVQLSLLDLNTDCLLQLVRYFNVEEMAIASDTCKQLQAIANMAFKYEYKSKMIFLSDEDQYSKIAGTAILRNFGHQLQKIYIDFDDEWNEYILEMVIDKCNSEQLTEVFLSQKIVERKNIDRFKSKFTNLKGLGLGNTPQNGIHLCEHFPSLVELTLFGYRFENEKVVQLVRLNPQLKSLQLEYTEQRIEKVKSLLESVDQQLPQLEQLELGKMTDHVAETRYQPKFFKNLRRLKLHNFGDGHSMQHLSISNAKVEQLELVGSKYDSGVTEFICNYKELEKLSIRVISSFDYENLLKLNDHLLKLSEFTISSRQRNTNHRAIIEFVLSSKQLVTLTIEDRQVMNITQFKKYLQKKLDKTKWAVDCYLSDNKLKIRKLS